MSLCRCKTATRPTPYADPKGIYDWLSESHDTVWESAQKRIKGCQVKVTVLTSRAYSDRNRIKPVGRVDDYFTSV